MTPQQAYQAAKRDRLLLPTKEKGVKDIIIDALIDIANHFSMKNALNEEAVSPFEEESNVFPLHSVVVPPQRMLIGFQRVEMRLSHDIHSNKEYERLADNILQPGQYGMYLTRTQVIFRPEGLSVKAAWANDQEEQTKLKPDPVDWLLVQDVKVGKNSQHPTADAIPARTYNKLFETSKSVRLDTCEISMFLTVNILNTSPRPIEVEVSMFGEVSSND